MTLLEALASKRDEILRIASAHGAGDVRVFGSAARGDATNASDVDLLVRVAGPTSPWFPLGLEEELGRLLGRKVDIVTEDGLYWLIRRRVLKEARPL
jgi:predicted nucleotidyltransferase